HGPPDRTRTYDPRLTSISIGEGNCSDDMADYQQPHQPCFCVLTNSRISNCLISRPGKKLFTASCSSLKISKIVVSLLATRSSTLRRFRFRSLTAPPAFERAVELMTTAPRPVLSM